MRTIEETHAFQKQVETLFRSVKEADDTVLLGVSWALTRASFNNGCAYPIVGALLDGRKVYALEIRETHFSNDLLIIFTVSSDDERVSLLDISEMRSTAKRQATKRARTNGDSTVK